VSPVKSLRVPSIWRFSRDGFLLNRQGIGLVEHNSGMHVPGSLVSVVLYEKNFVP
jgi:hypothetical protein